MPACPAKPTPARRLPRGVWALGLVSLLMDSSSELIHSLLPVLLTTVLGASLVTVGWIEGIAEATAAFTKLFSGVLSDRFRRRKPLVLAGYGLAALTKPVFALAPSVGWVFAARFTDRVGKGIRGAPRDALIADLAPPAVRGIAFGLRQALDSLGALIGPLLAIAGLALFAGDITATLWLAVVPAALAVWLLWRGVEEPAAPAAVTSADRPRWRDLRELPAGYWRVILAVAVFTLARFSEAFLILRGPDAGLATAQLPWIMVTMNLAYSLSAYPAGRAADRGARRQLLLAGLLALVAADLCLAGWSTPAGVMAGALLWGLHMGLTQGLMAKLVADTAPARLRGTGFGLFHLVSGAALLAASVLAGWLWQAFGAPATFLAGAGLALAAALGLVSWRR